MQKSTIYEVAELAGVSIATVSRFMNVPDKVSADARDRIVDAMKQLNFVPKADAVARARVGVKRIGVLAPYFTAPSFMQRLRGVQRVLSKTKYDLITYAVDTEEQLKNYLAMLPVTNRVDGLIIMSLPLTENDIARFSDNGIPIVCIETEFPHVTCIKIDNRKGGRMAARCFISCGYKKLGFVGISGQPSYTLHNSENRFAGFRDYAQSCGIEISDSSVVYLDSMPREKEKERIRQLLSDPDRPDALFFSSDTRAMTAQKIARELGIRVPDELGIIGFDDIDVAEYMGLTTVSQSLDLSGEKAAQLLVDSLENPGTDRLQISLDLKLIQRETTRKTAEPGFRT